MLDIKLPQISCRATEKRKVSLFGKFLDKNSTRTQQKETNWKRRQLQAATVKVTRFKNYNIDIDEMWHFVQLQTSKSSASSTLTSSSLPSYKGNQHAFVWPTQTTYAVNPLDEGATQTTPRTRPQQLPKMSIHNGCILGHDKIGFSWNARKRH